MLKTRRTFSRSRGVGLIELLIALAITAALLVATAAAVNAAFEAYAVNAQQADTATRLRLVMNRLTTTLRTAAEHAPVTAAKKSQFVAGQTVTDRGVAVIADDGSLLQFVFDPATRKLNVVDDGMTHELIDGVQAFDVTLQPRKSATAIKTGGGFDVLARATITIRVDTIDRAVGETNASAAGTTLTVSVAPRRTGW